MVSVRVATILFGLEDRPETAVNGAPAGSKVSTATEVTALILDFIGGDKPFVLVTADIIWFSSSLANSLRRQISAIVKTEEARVCLAASHSHGTPNCERAFAIDEWSQALEEHVTLKVLDVVSEALKAQGCDARIRSTKSEVEGLAINRRRKALAFRPTLSYRLQNLPNRYGICDNSLDVIVVEKKASGQPFALIVRYTCHPVADASNRRGADFPGAFRQTLRREFGPTLPILFLQGFCGDIRPNLQLAPQGLRDRLVNLVVGARFRKPRDDDARDIGERLGARVIEILRKNTTELSVKDGPIIADRRTIHLQLADQSAAMFSLDLTTWRWPGVNFVFASGEMLSGLLPLEQKGCLCVGYANGMVGYIPAESDLDAGGYEVDASRQKFGLSARLTPEACRQVARVISSAAQ